MIRNIFTKCRLKSSHHLKSWKWKNTVLRRDLRKKISQGIYHNDSIQESQLKNRPILLSKPQGNEHGNGINAVKFGVD